MGVALVALALVGCTTDQGPVAPSSDSTIEAAAKRVGPVGLAAAMAAQDRHSERLMANAGVVGTATGKGTDGQPAILVLAERHGIAGIPPSLDGVPVVVKVTGEIHALTDPSGRFARPVPTGVETGHPNISAGTIACRVKDVHGNVYALTNNHVYADGNNASIGDNVLQPGSYDGGVNPGDAIGTLADFEPIVFSRKAKNEIDAAIALSSTDDLGTGTPSGGYGTPNADIVGAVLGQPVQKFGRTTGLTKGEITGINATVKVSYGPGQTAKFVDQIIIGPGGFSAGGDSGSLIVTDDGNNNPVGLLFAGSSTITIGNRIDLVLDRFGVTVDGEIALPNAPPGVSITSPEDGDTFGTGALISFVGVASDTEDEDVTASFVWTSDLVGPIGTGGSFSATLSDGNHTVTAEATDSGGKTGSASVSITVGTAPPPPPPPTSLSITVGTDNSTYKIKDTALISGQVKDESGVGVQGATVSLTIDPPKGPNLSPVNSPITDVDGNYSFSFKTGKRTGTGDHTVTATAAKDGVNSNTAFADFVVTK
jgi:hypothetical protein